MTTTTRSALTAWTPGVRDDRERYATGLDLLITPRPEYPASAAPGSVPEVFVVLEFGTRGQAVGADRFDTLAAAVVGFDSLAAIIRQQGLQD